MKRETRLIRRRTELMFQVVTERGIDAEIFRCFLARKRRSDGY
jgi:hypothetical protein